jgi:glycogen synthase
VWIGRAGKTSFPMLSQKMKEFIEAQQQDIEIAVFGSGSYELSDSYWSFRQDRHVAHAVALSSFSFLSILLFYGQHKVIFVHLGNI